MDNIPCLVCYTGENLSTAPLMLISRRYIVSNLESPGHEIVTEQTCKQCGRIYETRTTVEVKNSKEEIIRKVVRCTT